MGRRSLWVFQAIAQARHKFGSRAIGEYIVSGARGPEDVLAVLLLARWADITDKRTGECPLDVAPLLESIDSLQSAGEVLRAIACRTRLSPASGIAGQSPNGGDRLLGLEQAGRNRGIALGIAGGAGSIAGNGACHGNESIDIPRARRHAGARRRTYRTPGRIAAEWRDARRLAADRTRRSRQSKL